MGKIAESAVEAMVARLNAHSRLTLQPDGGRVAVHLSACPWDFLVLLQPHLHFPSSMFFVQKLRPSLSVLLMECPGLTFFSPTARGRPQHVCRGPGSPRWPSVALGGSPVPACSQSLRGPGFVRSTNSTLSLNSAQLVTVDQ